MTEYPAGAEPEREQLYVVLKHTRAYGWTFESDAYRLESALTSAGRIGGIVIELELTEGHLTGAQEVTA